MNTDSTSSERWGVVLAGGEGERLRPFVERWFGSARPKQYCAFAGETSMLEHTWRRALAAVPASRLVTVIGRGHRRHLSGPAPGRLVEQPQKKETCPGVFLPLTYAMAASPLSTAAIFPSDHFIHPGEAFARRLSEAYSLAELLPGQLVLLAARAERCEADYGWIQPGQALPGFRRAFAVKRFVEKPPPEEAARLMAAGALWNTMIVVARTASLWRLGWELKPALMSRFEALKPHVGTSREAAALERVYEGMEASNFSRDILERAADRAVVLRMDGVSWCDWGRPERILETLSAIGREPAFGGLPAAPPPGLAARA